MDRGRRRGIIRILAGCLLAASCQDEAATEEWLGAFRGYPGARRLCSSQVLGVDRVRQVEISFTLYSASSEPSEVVRFYADAYALPSDPQQESIAIRPNDGPSVLSVSPVSLRYPDCGVKPSSEDPTVIVVSQMLSGAP